LHVPEENLHKYRALKRISDQFDSLGNALSNIGDYPLANAMWSKRASYNARAQELRAPAKPVHRPNGPYYPVGDLGGERCVKCETVWPCDYVDKTESTG